MSLTPSPTLRLKLTMPQALKLQFLPAVPGTNAEAAADRAEAAADRAEADTGGISGSGTDNHVVRWNGTSAVQDSGVVIDDAVNVIVNQNTGAPLAFPAGGHGIQVVSANGTQPLITLDGYGAAAAVVTSRIAGGTQSAPIAVPSGQILTAFGGAGWDGSAYGAAGGFQLRTREAWTGTAHGSLFAMRVVPPGSVTPFDVATVDASNAVFTLTGGLAVGGGEAPITVDTWPTRFQSVTPGGWWGASLFRTGANASGATVLYAKTRNASPTGHTVVAIDDYLGGVDIYGSDGTDYRWAGGWYYVVDAAPTAAGIPSHFELWTVNSAGSAAERFRVGRDGPSSFSGSVGTAAQVLTSQGASAPPTWTAGGGGSTLAFGTIVVAGQSNGVADEAPDTLTLVAGSNITITTNAAADTITINSTTGGAVDQAANYAWTGTHFWTQNLTLNKVNPLIIGNDGTSAGLNFFLQT